MRKAELGPVGDRFLLLRRSGRYYDEARRLDWTGELKTKLDAATAQLAMLAAAPGEAAPAEAPPDT